jgi:hypothetical protein
VQIIDDTLDESDETLTLKLSNPRNATIADDTATGTILDNDVTPTLSISDKSVNEGNTGTANTTFAVSLSAASGRTVTVSYATANGTATQPADYASTSGTLTFAPGDTNKNITVQIVGDTRDEADETLTLKLSNPSNANITSDTATVTILDDDATPTLSTTDKSVTEGNSGTINALFTVTLSAASGRTVTVSYATANGTATQPADYTSTSGTLTFAPGDTSKTISVQVVGDTRSEGNETFTVNLSNPVNADLTTPTVTGTIIDDDVPTLSIADRPVTEGNSGTTNALFTVSLSAPSTQTITVDYATANGTATQPVDYTSTSGTLTFAPGDTSKTISVPVVGDTAIEQDETFGVNLSTATFARIVDSHGRGTILNDDFDTLAPTVSFTTSATTPAGTTPVNGSTLYNVSALPTISGVAADSGTGVAKVTVRLYRPTATSGVNEYWDGSNWIIPGSGESLPVLSTVLSPSTGGANVTWSRSSGWPGSTNLSDGTYYVRAYAYDRVNNLGSTSVSSFFKSTDTAVPTASFTSSATTPAGTTPVHGTTVYNLSAFPTISGVAADSDSGVARVQLHLYRSTTTSGVNEYWDGSNWIIPNSSALIPLLSTTLSPGAGGANVTWSRSSGWPTVENLPNTRYYLRAYAYDRAGKVSTAASTNFFKSTDTVQPSSVVVTTPSSGSTISALSSISGTAADNSGGSGLGKVDAYLRRRNSSGVYEYWALRSGSWNWGTSVTPLATTLSGNTWSVSNSSPAGTVLPSDANLPSGSYSVFAYAFDKAANRLVGTAHSFTVSAPAAAASTSSVVLSSGVVRASSQSLVLSFNGPLDAAVATEASHYQVSVDGQTVEVESVGYDAASHRIMLGIAQGALSSSSQIEVTVKGLYDAQGRLLNEQTLKLKSS